jgi:glucoamylase
LCQGNADSLDVAVYTIEGRVRENWARQNDGPALQVLALLAGFPQLDAAGQDTARAVIAADLEFVLARYRDPGFNLWEEVHGQSFFTRSVQLRCLTEIAGNTAGLAVPSGVAEAVAWLTNELASHWNGSYYVSVRDAGHPRDGYDPNIDIVSASVYGWVDCADPKLLATAGLLRRQWAGGSSGLAYPVNEDDAAHGLGPLLGRYPGDVYDGDRDDTGTGHPWALCTANYAELYYTLAGRIAATGQVPWSDLAADFFGQAGVGPSTAAGDASGLLVAAADRMLQAIVYHSDHLELSEQFDKVTGYEKSVRDLTWSYAAFLSAVRARAMVGAASAPVTPA